MVVLNEGLVNICRILTVGKLSKIVSVAGNWETLNCLY